MADSKIDPIDKNKSSKTWELHTMIETTLKEDSRINRINNSKKIFNFIKDNKEILDKDIDTIHFGDSLRALFMYKDVNDFSIDETLKTLEGLTSVKK